MMSKRVCLSLNPKRRCYAILVRLMGILDIHELGEYYFPPYERYSVIMRYETLKMLSKHPNKKR